MGKILKFILDVILFIPRLILSAIGGLFKMLFLFVIALLGLAYYTGFLGVAMHWLKALL
jgi:hypothetical protein